MRKEKPLLLDEIKQKIDASTAMFVASYTNLEPNLSWKLRDSLAKNGSVLEVVRKRVFLKAAALSGVQVDESLLSGHIGVVFVNQPDALAPAKVVFQFSEDNGKVINVHCGTFEGKMMPGAELEILSKLPGIDDMRATMLALFTAPMSQTLSVLEAMVNAQSSSVENEQNS